MSNFRLLFSFRGRATRKPFWLFILAYAVISILIALIGQATQQFTTYRWQTTTVTAPARPGGPPQRVTASLSVNVLSAIWMLLALWPSLAITVKRLHDRGTSGWWLFAYYAALFGSFAVIGFQATGVGPITAQNTNLSSLGLAVIASSLGLLALSIWLLIEIGFRRGTVGINRFGPDPLSKPTGATW